MSQSTTGQSPTGQPFTVFDNGDLKKYRTEIPNIIDDADISVYAFRLYVHLKRVAGADAGGYCRQGTAKLAANCNMSAGKVSDAKQELVAAHLIHIERAEGYTDAPDIITILDIWPANFAAYANAGSKAKQPLHRNSTPSRREDPPSPHERTPSCGEQTPSPHETKKEPIKKELFKEEEGVTSTRLVPQSILCHQGFLFPEFTAENNFQPAIPQNLISQEQSDKASVSDKPLPEAKVKVSRPPRAVFMPPTLEQAEKYFTTQGRPDLAPAFMDHFLSNGWLIGKAKAPMKDWEAAARQWCRNDAKFNQPTLGFTQNQIAKGGYTHVPSAHSVTANSKQIGIAEYRRREQERADAERGAST